MNKKDKEPSTPIHAPIKTGRDGSACRRVLIGLAVTSSLIPYPSSLAWAAHPFITDDTGTQGAGNWQLELMAQQGRINRIADAGAGPVELRSRVTAFNPVLTYGFRDTLDIALGGNYLRQKDSQNGAEVTTSGTADSTLELKWRFYDDNGFSMALKPGLSLPTGDENKGLGSGKTSWAVNFIAAYEAKPWSFMGNVAYARARFELPQDAADNRRDLWRISAGAAYSISEQFRLTGELGSRTNEASADPFLPGRNARFAMLGAIYSPTEKIDLDIGLRKGLNRAEDDTVFLIGATFRW